MERATAVFIALFFFVLCPAGATAQDRLSLSQCYQLAVQNYPLSAQKPLIDSAGRLTVQNLQHNYLPQLQLNSQATYQSEVTAIPVKIPNVNLPSLDKDQYKAAVDVNQLIYDGRTTYFLKQQQIISDIVKQQQVDVQLYALRNEVNQYYFSILLYQEREDLIKTEEQDIWEQLRRTETGVKYGADLQVTADILHAQLLTLDQQLADTRADHTAALRMLGSLLFKTLNENTVLDKPVVQVNYAGISLAGRPEETLFTSEAQQADVMRKSVDTRYRPMLSAFGEGGYGRPGLNMLTNAFSPYAVGGVKLTWNIWNWHSARNEKSIWALNKEMVQSQKQTFELTTNIELVQEQEEISKAKELISQDDDIISLRSRIVDKVVSQLNNGVITATDYVIQLDARTVAELNKKLHELQLLMANVNYLTLQGINIQ